MCVCTCSVGISQMGQILVSIWDSANCAALVTWYCANALVTCANTVIVFYSLAIPTSPAH